MRSDWLDAFLEFSKSMNFTTAARALNISQPALHVKIRKLADWLGVPLYHKVGRTLVLTPEGGRVSAYAREQKERSKDFVERLRTGSTDSPVVLCAGEGAYSYLLGPAISSFSKDGQNKLKLMTGNQEMTFEALLSGQAHLGVSAPDTLPAGLSATELTNVDQVIVMPEDHPLAGLRKIRLENLDGEDLIVPPNPRPHRVMINRMLMAADVSWNVAVEANGWELMLQFVELGLGLAIVNGCCRIDPGLVAKPLPQLPRVRYQLLHATGRWHNTGAVALREHLLKHKDTWQSG